MQKISVLDSSKDQTSQATKVVKAKQQKKSIYGYPKIEIGWTEPATKQRQWQDRLRAIAGLIVKTNGEWIKVGTCKTRGSASSYAGKMKQAFKKLVPEGSVNVKVNGVEISLSYTPRV